MLSSSVKIPGKSKKFLNAVAEKAFLKFFFSRLKWNDGGRYPEFPYVSPCGHEQNYIRCDDLPIVFTHLVGGGGGGGDQSDDGAALLAYGGAGDSLTVPFDPTQICMLAETGRVYHRGVPHLGDVGLVKSKLAIELSKYFEFESDTRPTHFVWNGVRHALTNSAIPLLEDERARVKRLMDT